MFYFKLITLIFGVLAITMAPVIFFMPGKYRHFLSSVLLPEKRAPWIWLPVFAYGALLILTWYVEFNSSVRLSWVVTLIFSMGLVKIYLILFRYDQFREILLKLMEKDRLFQWGLGSLSYVTGIFILVLGMYGLR
ncbi:MAG TPA: hypothetical protein PLV56_02710 [Synergistales bacterium]|nr:hypothetical protein [Synergistales bacterium]